MPTIGQILRNDTPRTSTPACRTTSIDCERAPCRRCPPRAIWTSGENFTNKPDWRRVQPGLRAAIAKAFQSDRWPWYICGPAGTGKSFAAACIYQRHPADLVAFWPVSRVVRDLAGGYLNILLTVQDLGLLILDDFGTRTLTDPQADALLSILNTRGRKPLIVTGNHDTRQLRDCCRDDRIVSRLLSGVVIEVKGSDQRLAAAHFIEA